MELDAVIECRIQMLEEFQSTSSVWSSTAIQIDITPQYRISIHELRVELDMKDAGIIGA